MRQTLTVLTALCLSFALSACGLKGPLYLSTPNGAPPPAAAKPAKADNKSAETPANKGGDDNKAPQN